MSPWCYSSAFLSPLRPHSDNYSCDTCCVANVVALDMGSFFLVLSVFFRIFQMHCEHHLYPQTQIANVIISTTIYMPHWWWVFSKTNAEYDCCRWTDMKVNDFHLLSNLYCTVLWSFEVSSISSIMLMGHSQLLSLLCISYTTISIQFLCAQAWPKIVLDIINSCTEWISKFHICYYPKKIMYQNT